MPCSRTSSRSTSSRRSRSTSAASAASKRSCAGARSRAASCRRATSFLSRSARAVIVAITWLVFDRIAERAQGVGGVAEAVLDRRQRVAAGAADHDFLPRLKKLKSALDERGFGLTIELTEDSLVQSDDSSLASLERVRKLGVDLSIDDFGKGYSSLSYLKQIPATEIKIDKRFIGTIAIDEKDQQIVKTVDRARARARHARRRGRRGQRRGAGRRARASVARWRRASSSAGRCAAISSPSGSTTTSPTRDQLRRSRRADLDRRAAPSALEPANASTRMRSCGTQRVPTGWSMGLLLDFAYLLACVLALAVDPLPARARARTARLRDALRGRARRAGSSAASGCTASSAGEVTLLKPLVALLEREHARHAARDLRVHEHRPRDGAQAVSAAHASCRFRSICRSSCAAALRRFDPRLVIIVESEFWPNFIRVCAPAAAMPSSIVNGKMSAKSQRVHARTRPDSARARRRSTSSPCRPTSTRSGSARSACPRSAFG